MARCFPEHRPASVRGLHDYQADAVHRLRAILQQRRGAILADSVGLGKTHVAAALARAAQEDGDAIMVSAPAHLHEHWRRHMRGIEWVWQSHTSLSRRSALEKGVSLIIVDEAHAFRNPRTRRYASLAIGCTRAHVLLLTATPVNNSLLDFYHLVRLFAGRGDFADIGVPDLDVAVRSALEGASSQLRRIADAVLVRRTRRAVATDFDSHPPFPVLGPITRILHDSPDSGAVIVKRVLSEVPRLEFPAHAGTDAGIPELLRLGLLKRMESSTWALSASLRRHMRILDAFSSAARTGRLFDPRRDAVELAAVDGATQLTLHALTLPPWPAGVDPGPAVAAAERDLARLRNIASAVAAAGVETHGKVGRLRTLLDEMHPHDRVVIFTEFRETAVGLWRALLPTQRVGLVHGSGAALGRHRASRRFVVERFAPGTASRQPVGADDVRILVATDVLAEGMNLQAARVAICYDLPWNPIRIAQRIGRIDRLGSPHSRIEAFAFVPDRQLDEVLGLMRRIRRKLKAVRVVGGDAPWSIATSRRATALLGALDETCEARARARLLWRRSGHRPGPPRAAPVFGVVPHDAACDAAIVCFRLGRAHILVLVREDGTSEIDTAACWNALATGARSTDESRHPLLAGFARQVVRRARQSLRQAGTPTSSAALDRTGLNSVTTTLRRLARNWNIHDGAIDAAESAMLQRAAGGPAGMVECSRRDSGSFPEEIAGKSRVASVGPALERAGRLPPATRLVAVVLFRTARTSTAPAAPL